MLIKVVGIDCAANEAKIGIALGEWQQGLLRVDRVLPGDRRRSAVETIAEWLGGCPSPVLLAIDAPLGWPAPLSRALKEHRAGEPIDIAPHEMFRRMTDRFIQEAIEKTPLDVGADRIARTAHAALRMLGGLRKRLDSPVPLAWSPESLSGVMAIEVYPAATLVVHGLRSSGYKAAKQVAERREILKALRQWIRLPADLSTMEKSADALDSVICLMAAKDFLEGRAMRPPEPSLAEQEGWIWAAPRVAATEHK